MTSVDNVLYYIDIFMESLYPSSSMTERKEMTYSIWGDTPASARAGYQVHTVRAPDFWTPISRGTP